MSSRTDFGVVYDPAKKKSAPRSSAKSGSALKKRRSAYAESIRQNSGSTFGALFTTDSATPKEKANQKPATNVDDDGEDDDTLEVGPDGIFDLTEPKRKVPASKPAEAPKEKALLKPRVNSWIGIKQMAMNTGFHSITTVDPGTRNCAIMRIEVFPVIRVTHVRILDLSELCENFERANPNVTLEQGGSYPIDSQLFALQQYVVAEARSKNGIFNSSMVLVEEQCFSRDMARVDATIVAAVNSVLPPRKVSELNAVPAAQILSARSVKTCYRPFFPDVDEGQKPASNNGRRPFGMGDVRNGESDAQHRLNKVNTIKHGRLIIGRERVESLLPPDNLTSVDRSRIRGGKLDDMYDSLFLCLYWCSCYLFHYNKLRDQPQEKQEKFSALGGVPQRPLNCWQEVFEFCSAIGTPKESIDQLIKALLVDEQKNPAN